MRRKICTALICMSVMLTACASSAPSEYFTFQPSSNGAWLAQNSMGGTSLYWISYESPLDEVVSFEVTDAAVESIGMEDDEWGVSAITVSHEGESFIRVNGEWHDMSLEGTADMLGAEGLLNNCCLKGFYVTTQ